VWPRQIVYEYKQIKTYTVWPRQIVYEYKQIKTYTVWPKEKREKILIEEWLNEKTKKIENYFERIGELEKDKQNVCFKQSL
jgi:hypothetical protein